MVIYEFVLEV